MTKDCNFNCWWCSCSQCTSRKKVKPLNQEALLNFFEKCNMPCRIVFTGGEPFLVPNLKEIAIKIIEKHKLTINSNLSASCISSFLKGLTKSPQDLLFNVSAHIKEMNRTKTEDLFIENMKTLINSSIPFYVSIILDPALPMETLNKHKKRIESETGIVVSYKPVYGCYKGLNYPESYTKTQNSLFTHIHHQVKPITLNPKGCVCTAGFNTMCINDNGDLFQCLNDLTRDENSMGNIENGCLPRDHLIRCPYETCNCPIHVWEQWTMESALRESGWMN